MATKDELIEHYAAELDRIYVNRTKGAYTFEGVLASLLMDLERAE